MGTVAQKTQTRKQASTSSKYSRNIRHIPQVIPAIPADITQIPADITEIPADMENIAKKSDVTHGPVVNIIQHEISPKAGERSDVKESENAEPVSKISDKAIEETKISDEAIKEIFATFDKNGDGCVNVMEIKDLISSLGGNLSDQEATAMVKMADSDKSGDITINEFRRLWSAMQITEDEDDIKEEFERMDPNGDGYITKDELADLLRKTALIRDVDREAQKCLEDMDINSDGKVSYEEFLLIWKYRK